MCHVYKEDEPLPDAIIADIHDWFETDFFIDINKSIPALVSRLDPGKPVFINMNSVTSVLPTAHDNRSPITITMDITITPFNASLPPA